MKICKTCGATYTKYRGNGDTGSRCLDCYNAFKREWYRANRIAKGLNTGKRVKFADRFPIVADLIQGGLHTIEQLANSLKISFSATSTFLRKAETLGLLYYEEKEVMYFYLTDKSHQDLAQVIEDNTPTFKGIKSSLTPTDEQSAWVRRLFEESQFTQTEYDQVVWVNGLMNVSAVQNVRTFGTVKVGQVQIRNKAIQVVYANGQWEE